MNELIEILKKEFSRSCKRDLKITAILDKVEAGLATYADAQELSVLVGKGLSTSMLRYVTEDFFDGDNFTREEAEALLTPMLEDAFERISTPTAQIQKTLNQKAGLGLNAQKPGINQERLNGLCEKISSYPTYAESKWVLDRPVVNFCQNVVDESIKANAEFQYEAGLVPKIIRKPDSGACKWCLELAGEYTYPNVPQDVYRRHEDCNCSVEYDPADGRKGRQNVWDKQWR